MCDGIRNHLQTRPRSKPLLQGDPSSFPSVSSDISTKREFQQTSQPAVGRWRCCTPASQLTPQPTVLSCCSQCQSENFLLMFVMNKIPGLSVKKSHHLLNFRECEEAPGVVQNPGRPAKRRPASCPRNQPASLLTELSSQSPSTLRSEIKLFSLQPRSHNSPQVLIKARLLFLKPGQDPAPTSPVIQSKAR